MNFDSPQSLLTDVTLMLQANGTVMRNRTLVNRLFNGEAPNTEEERRAENLKTNINWLEATRIASNASNQLNNAFFKGDRFFTVRLDKGPQRMRQMWGASITKHINRELKKSRTYRSARESANAQVVLHGPGPMAWRNRRTPIPETDGVEDVLVPAGTLAGMDNLDRFAIYREMTWNQLESQALGPTADSGWNKPYVTALLQTLYKQGVVPIYQGNRWMFPEKVAEDYKEGAAQSAGSALPKVMIYDFFYRSDKTDKWSRKMILDYDNIGGSGISKESSVSKGQDFLYEKDDYADDWSEIIHWYIGNCSNVAPYRYYSIRSIGYLLYGSCLVQNKLRNRLYDHMFQSLLTLFRNVSDDNREKLGLIDLQNFGVMPDGVSMVPANERHVVDWNLILMGLNQGRQLMAESAASFVPENAGGTGKTMTATETLVRQNTSITLTSAVLNQLGDQSTYEYNEICRRFCIKNNPDPMAKRFREAIRKDGVPMDMLDCEAWEVLPEQTLGGGNKAVELTVSEGMMQIYTLVDPDAQRTILRQRVLALTDNPEMALEMVPNSPTPPSDDVQYAQFAFSILMLGVPFAQKEGVNHVAFTAMLLSLMKVKVDQAGAAIKTPTGIPTAAEWIAALFNVAQHIGTEIAVIGKAEQTRDTAKDMFKMLSELMGQLQQMAKELMAMEESQNQNGGVSPETMAKIQESMALAQNKMQIDQMKAQQKLEQKNITFGEENQRRNAMVASDIQRKMAMTQVEIASTDLTTEAEILRIAREPQSTE